MSSLRNWGVGRRIQERSISTSAEPPRAPKGLDWSMDAPLSTQGCPWPIDRLSCRGGEMVGSLVKRNRHGNYGRAHVDGLDARLVRSADGSHRAGPLDLGKRVAGSSTCR